MNEKKMEGLRWPAMVFGIFGGVAAFISGFLDIIAANLAGGLVALAASLIVFAISAMTPSLPGWSAVLFVAVAFVLLLVSSIAVAIAGPLLLIAALLAAPVAWSRRRNSAQQS